MRPDASQGEEHQQQGQQPGQAFKESLSSHLHVIGLTLGKLKLSAREERAWKAIQDNASERVAIGGELSNANPELRQIRKEIKELFGSLARYHVH
jgi:hypothetical protein